MTLFRLTAVAVLAMVAGSCGKNPKALEVRLWSDSYAIRVTVDPMPPRAMEQTPYRIVVLDKKSKQPIETGEGRIFATSKDGANTNDGFKKEKELGTYSGRLFFATTGDWAMAIQFRRDKNNPRMPLERVDWIQSVSAESEPGS